jgi:hypothetical protein
VSRTVFGRYEVEACKIVRFDDGDAIIEVCPDSEAEFYSTYRRDEQGLAECVYDSHVRELAEDKAQFLNKQEKSV